MNRRLILHVLTACILASGLLLAGDATSPGLASNLTSCELSDEATGRDHGNSDPLSGYDDEYDDEGDDRVFCVCHNGHTKCIPLPALCAHLAHGDTMGPCEDTCGGQSGDTCDDDQFCRRPVGECDEDAEGTCAEIPEICPLVFAPVCGCDDETYDNRCWAAAAGVTVAYPGECEADLICGGEAGDTCDDDQFCKRPEGECGMDAEGQCAETPEMCPAIFAPVCGCDGRTYSNRCYADVAGVTVDHRGPCENQVACGGDLGDTCDQGAFCRRRLGECDEATEGVCAPTPMNCPTVFDPVCGCDGETYGNRCRAAAAGVNVASKGECSDERICGRDEDAPCLTGEFCKRRPGDCADDAAGICTEIPMNCPGILKPVCSCDGTTYDNACLAAAAEATIAYEGECREEIACDGAAGDTCGDDQFCRQLEGECSDDDEGICVDKPEDCSMIIDQVCGCDDKTYDNKCFAAAAGVNVKHGGPCRMHAPKSIQRSQRRR